jgi:hypothetical protein
MLEERWSAVAVLAARAKMFQAQERVRLALQCNDWFSRQQLDERDEVEREIGNWDTSALSPLFRFIRTVLLERWEEAFDVLPSVLDSGHLLPGELREWPILSKLRSHLRYREFST